MSLRLRLHAYLVALHLLLFALAAALLLARPLPFVLVELALLASLAGGFHLLERALAPLGYTQRFHDLLQDQNYAARLVHTDVPELDQLVDLFNRMLGALYRERLEIGEQQGFLDRLLEATPGAVLVFDFDGAISLLNASAGALLELEAPLGKPLAAWRDGPGHARSRELIAQLDALPLDERRLLTDLDGRRYRAQRGRFFDRGFARHFLMVEELTAELESSERATYDKLVRVLAHEVNNTVAATGSVLDSLLYYRAQLAERDGVDFATAIEAVKRRNASLGEFIERFTRVVKMPEPELRPAGIAAMMDDIVWLTREQCKQRAIHIGWIRCDAVPMQPVDSQLMEQALLNIVKNAVEAVEASGQPGGYIHLALAAGVGAGAPTLSVIDSGNQLGGVPARQLFTPFFSTKKGGQGIGLVFVREVLTRHGFAYQLASTGDGETRFDIQFGAAMPRTPV
ncbi:MAG: ATP-binding protein [Pseudomonadota bacterium]|nr:ATP-binding protein [Pseudomonadota bacterium]